jgi:hypothetical protein
MKIGIIGAGYVGGTLATKLAEAGHHVRLANSKDPATLAEFEEVAGITPAWAADAVTDVDVAILSLPQKVIPTLSDEVLTALRTAKVVIDTGNYYPARDGRIEPLDQGVPDSEWVAAILGRPVYKVFNNIMAPSLKHKSDSDPRLAATVAGPAGEDKNRVYALVGQIGFDPVDAGDLDQSWRLQPGTPTYCQDMTADQIRVGVAATSSDDIETYHAARDAIEDFDAAMATMRQYM